MFNSLCSYLVSSSFYILENQSEDRVHRACGTIDDGDVVKRGDCYYKSGYNTRTWVCSCKEDKCNDAPALRVGNVAIVAVLVNIFVAIYVKYAAEY